MAENFPSIGRLQLEGFSETPDSGLERSEFENGAVKQTETISRGLLSLPVVYLFSAAEMATWRTFWRDTLHRGSDWFNWNDPRVGEARLTRIVGGAYQADAFTESDGAPLSWRVAMRFEQWDDA